MELSRFRRSPSYSLGNEPSLLPAGMPGISSAVRDDTESLLEELREDIYNYMDEYGPGPR